MVDLTYYNEKVVTLEQLLEVLEETGYKAMLVDELGEIQIELEPLVVCIWQPIPYEEIDNPNVQAYVNERSIKSVHVVTLNSNLTPHLRRFLKLLFTRYGGWIVDDETPNFKPETKGQEDIYTIDNVDEFLRTVPPV